jgi:hypothetical protein
VLCLTSSSSYFFSICLANRLFLCSVSNLTTWATTICATCFVYDGVEQRDNFFILF